MLCGGRVHVWQLTVPSPAGKKKKRFPNNAFKVQHFSACPPRFTFYCTGQTQIQKEIPKPCAEKLAVTLTVFLISDVHFADEVISQFKHCFSLCGSYWVHCKHLAIFFPASLLLIFRRKSKTKNNVSFTPLPANKKCQTFFICLIVNYLFLSYILEAILLRKNTYKVGNRLLNTKEYERWWKPLLQSCSAPEDSTGEQARLGVLNNLTASGWVPCKRPLII